MGIVIGNFSDGWQNKARRELMKDTALYKCEDLEVDEIGALRCRYQHTEQSYFVTQTLGTPVIDLFLFNVEGRDHRLVYYRCGTTLYCWNSYTGETRTVSTSVTGDHVSMAVLRPVLATSSYVYITDGTSMFCDNGSTDYSWGIDPPDNLPLVAMAGAGGNLSAGDYSYRYTFYDSTTGTESDPSVASATTTAAANDLATVTQIQISPNPRVDRRRIYRTLVGGGVWYLVASLNDNVTTEYEDPTADADITVELDTDHGVPPYGDIVVSYKDRLFLSGNQDYPNRVWFSDTENPDNWCSTSYLDVGTTNDRIVDMVEFEGKLYFMQTTTISGLYGSDEETFAWHKTRSHVGVSARWSVAAGPDGVYFLAHDGVYRFDGLKAVKVSEAIDGAFELRPDTWTEIIDTKTVATVARACFMQGKYHLVVPMYIDGGSVSNRLLVFDVFSQIWTKYLVACTCICPDVVKGLVLGGLVDGGGYSVFELMNTSTGSDTCSPSFVTKTYSIVGESDKARAVSWVRRFRVDCKGSWVVYFYVDGSLVHTETLTSQSESTRYVWYNFGPKIKGRYLFVYATGTSATPYANVFNELEIV